MINGLLNNHTLIKDDDLPDVKTFKRILSDELKTHVKLSNSDTLHSIPIMCSSVDPRYSSLNFSSTEQRGIVCDNAVEFVESLLEQGETTRNDTEEPQSKRPKRKSAMQFLLTNNIEDDQEDENPRTVRDEIEKFMEQRDLHPDSDPLFWWKENNKQFPKLALCARKLLCIQVTSVPAERVFSVAGSIVTKKRAILNPENVDMLIFLIK